MRQVRRELRLVDEELKPLRFPGVLVVNDLERHALGEAAIAHLLDSHLAGPVNLAGPTPATADRVMTAMAERMHRPYTFTVPERMLELALGRAADELLLSSQKVRPQRLIDDGFRFEHVNVDSALEAMLSAPRARA